MSKNSLRKRASDLWTLAGTVCVRFVARSFFRTDEPLLELELHRETPNWKLETLLEELATETFKRR